MKHWNNATFLEENRLLTHQKIKMRKNSAPTIMYGCECETREQVEARQVPGHTATRRITFSAYAWVSSKSAGSEALNEGRKLTNARIHTKLVVLLDRGRWHIRCLVHLSESRTSKHKQQSERRKQSGVHGWDLREGQDGK
jgi:hypothetical protein